MTPQKHPGLNDVNGVSRRDFIGATASTGALLAMAPEMLPSQVSDRRPQSLTFFLNLAHEDHVGHEYLLYVAGRRHPIQEIGLADAANQRALQTNSFLAAIPKGQITHVVQGVSAPANQVLLSYVLKDPDTATGQWQMSAVYLIPPLSGLISAYQRSRAVLGEGDALPLSAKRALYGIAPARTYRDLVEEHMLLDSNDWAAALVNIHPEILSAEANSAAHIQTNYINTSQRLPELAFQLRSAGPAQPQTGTADNGNGWATLVPYTHDNGAPLINQKGANKGLIQYDPHWQPSLKTTINSVTNSALRLAKNDTTLGVNIADPAAATTSRGAIWTRTDGSTTVNQTASPGGRAVSADNIRFTLTNVTPNFAGYNCTVSNSGESVTLKATNWYLHYLAFYIQFYKDSTVVPASALPPGIVPEAASVTANNEILLQQINPEFTLYGIPLQSSSATFTFTFPSGVANGARVIASGLGVGRHLSEDTELLGIIMTSIFNFILPLAVLVLGLGTTIDIFVKQVAIPFALTVAQVIEAAFTGSGVSIGTIFWRSFSSGTSKGIGPFVATFDAYLVEEGIITGVEDAIPIAGLIFQAIGIAGTTAELAESTAETLLSPKSYIYTLVGTYDLTLAVKPDPRDAGGFPASAATYTVTAIFDNGTPHTVTSAVPGGSPGVLRATLSAVPIGGTVVLSVGFYTVDGTLVGHGTTGSLPNVPPSPADSGPSITLTEIPLPITAASVYQHKQLTMLDSSGHHQWVCAPAPPSPNGTSDCADQPGSICSYRNISVSTQNGDIGYGWQSFAQDGCNGGAGLLDQMASVRIANAGTNVQSTYAALPCALSGAARLAYDPLGRDNANFYLDSSGDQNLLRAISLNPPQFQDPKSNMAWGRFTLATDDLLLHPGGVLLSVNQGNHRLESLQLPSAPLPDNQASTNLVADLHGGFGTRPGLFTAPVLATITSGGVVLVLEQGNNRIHAVDAFGNPVRHFHGQSVPYFLVLSETGPEATYLDIASEYSGLIYVLSFSAGIYRLDIYDPRQASATPLSTTRNFNAAKVAVDYWRNVYSLDYTVLASNSASPVTEPQISQWIPTTPPPCASDRSPRSRTRQSSGRLLRRRDLLLFQPSVV